MTITRYRFEESFDNGATEYAEAQKKIHVAEIEAARHSGYEKGYADGCAQTLDSIHAHISNMLDKAYKDMEKLFEDVDLVKRTIIADGAKIATEIGCSMGSRSALLFPVERISAAFDGALKDIIDVPRLVFRLNPDIMDEAKRIISEKSQAFSYAGKLIFIPDDTLEKADVIMEWSYGGLDLSLESQRIKLRTAADVFAENILNGGEVGSAGGSDL